MKKILFSMITLAVFAFSASAQQHGNKHEKPTPAQITERMTEQLGLTDEQKSKVLDLNTEFQDVAGGFHGRPGGGPRGPKPDGNSGATNGNQDNRGHQPPELTEEQKAKFEEMRAKREEYNNKLKAILTDEQYTKYEESHKHGHGHGHGPHPDKNDKNK